MDALTWIVATVTVIVAMVTTTKAILSRFAGKLYHWSSSNQYNQLSRGNNSVSGRDILIMPITCTIWNKNQKNKRAQQIPSVHPISGKCTNVRPMITWVISTVYWCVASKCKVLRNLCLNKKHSKGTDLRRAWLEKRETVQSGVKETIQLPFLSIFWKFRKYPSTRYSVIFLTKTKIEKRIMYPSCIQELKCNITKMFQIVPGITADISWKFHKKKIFMVATLSFPIHYAMTQRQPIGCFYQSYSYTTFSLDWIRTYNICWLHKTHMCLQQFIQEEFSWEIISHLGLSSINTLSELFHLIDLYAGQGNLMQEDLPWEIVSNPGLARFNASSESNKTLFKCRPNGSHFLRI